MENIKIQIATISDIDKLQKISSDTFFETFATQNSKKDMDQYLLEHFSIQQLKSELENKQSTFFFAVEDNDVIGYVKLNTGNAQTEKQANDSFEIERIYVLQKYHGKKVGQILYNKAIQIAKENRASYVWLGVWEENQRAIHFYKKNGFVEFDKHIFKLGNDEQTDILMKLVLD